MATRVEIDGLLEHVENNLSPGETFFINPVDYQEGSPFCAKVTVVNEEQTSVQFGSLAPTNLEVVLTRPGKKSRVIPHQNRVIRLDAGETLGFLLPGSPLSRPAVRIYQINTE